MDMFENDEKKQDKSLEKSIQVGRTYENMFSSDTYRKKASDTLQKIENMQKNIHKQSFDVDQNDSITNQSPIKQTPKRTESLLFQKIRERQLQEQKEESQISQNLQQGQTSQDETLKTEDIACEAEQSTETITNSQKDSVNIKQLSEILEETKISQPNKPPIKPQKNYSFRIKLACGVYVILVALFGGWIISNAVNITNTNNQIVETVESNSQYEADIAKLVKSINDLNKANENDPSLEVSIITNTIEISPKPLDNPTQITPSSNWFDAICNWFARIFGG